MVQLNIVLYQEWMLQLKQEQQIKVMIDGYVDLQIIIQLELGMDST